MNKHSLYVINVNVNISDLGNILLIDTYTFLFFGRLIRYWFIRKLASWKVCIHYAHLISRKVYGGKGILTALNIS